MELKDSSALPTNQNTKKTNISQRKYIFLPSTTSITQRALIIDGYSFAT
jgi:hypothetical protein